MTLNQLAMNLQLSKSTFSRAFNGEKALARRHVAAVLLGHQQDAASWHLFGPGRRRIACLGAIVGPVALRLGATSAPVAAGA